VLLQIPKGKKWKDSDLENENNLRTGLHVLYNRIQGKEELHFGKAMVNANSSLRSVLILLLVAQGHYSAIVDLGAVLGAPTFRW
jgi:hypothetical protein